MAPPRLARRRFIGAATAFVPGLAVGANLPSDNGAKGDQRGTVAALVPIVRVTSSVLQASRAVQAGKLQDAQKALDAIPATEKPFKRLFDEYSEPVSYKQKYKDSNAFVVYYTQGFDLCGNQPVCRVPRQFFTKSFLGDDAAVLARSSGEESTSPRHRASVASIAWRSTQWNAS